MDEVCWRLHLLKVTGALAEVEVTGARSNAGPWTLSQGGLEGPEPTNPYY